MPIDTLVLKSVWADLAAGLAVYAASYLLGVYEVFLYHAGARRFIVMEGRYRKADLLDEKTGAPRWISPRFLATLAVLAAAILGAYGALQAQNRLPEVFAFLMGGLVLMELGEIARRLWWVSLFRSARPGGGLTGEISLSYRLSGMLGVVDLYTFVGLYGLVFLLSGSWFFLGGTVTCFIASRRLRDWFLTARERV